MITDGEMATAIIASSATLLGLSALILVTIRLSKFTDIKDRVTPLDYDRLYDWTLISIYSGFASVITVLALFLFHQEWMLTLAGFLLFSQVITLLVSFIRFFDRLKICIRKNRVQDSKQRALEKIKKERFQPIRREHELTKSK